MSDRSAPSEALARQGLDEQKVAQAFRIGLPAVTIVGAICAGIALGPASAILVLAAGTLLGTIALFWASLRVLSGDVALPPELEALDASAHAIDALASRKKMLLRALKDLDNEHALGKLDDEDYAELPEMYRRELKEILRRIDESLAEYRPAAEKLARAHLSTVGLAERRADDSSEEVAPTDTKTKPAASRRVCAKCSASNEPDAKFCKECASPLTEADSKE